MQQCPAVSDWLSICFGRAAHPHRNAGGVGGHTAPVSLVAASEA